MAEAATLCRRSRCSLLLRLLLLLGCAIVFLAVAATSDLVGDIVIGVTEGKRERERARVEAGRCQLAFEFFTRKKKKKRRKCDDSSHIFDLDARQAPRLLLLLPASPAARPLAARQEDGFGDTAGDRPEQQQRQRRRRGGGEKADGKEEEDR